MGEFSLLARTPTTPRTNPGPRTPTTTTGIPKTTVTRGVTTTADQVVTTICITTTNTTITSGVMVGDFHMLAFVTMESTAIIVAATPIVFDKDLDVVDLVIKRFSVDHKIQPFFKRQG